MALTSSEDLALYGSREADFYGKQTQSLNLLRRWYHRFRYRALARLVRSYYRQGMVVLDAGCGSSAWNQLSILSVGLDINRALLAQGLKKGRLAEAVLCDVSCMGIREESVDLIAADSLLEHIGDPYEL